MNLSPLDHPRGCSLQKGTSQPPHHTHWDPPPLPQLGPSQPQLPHSRWGGGAPPKHSPPGSCCSAGWNGESRCVPGTPAFALRQPPSCGDRKGTIGGRKTWAAGPWELGLWGPQIHTRRGKPRLWKEKKKSSHRPREPRIQDAQVSAWVPPRLWQTHHPVSSPKHR